MSVVYLKNFLFESFLEIIIKASVADFIFSKIPCFQHILLNKYRRMRLKCEKYYLRRILFRHHKKQHLDYKSLIAKQLNESCKSCLGNKDQKLMFLVMSRSGVRFVFEHLFFASTTDRASKIARPKSRAPRQKFFHPWHSKCTFLCPIKMMLRISNFFLHLVETNFFYQKKVTEFNTSQNELAFYQIYFYRISVL